METFPLPYLWKVDRDTEFSTTTVKFQSGKEQVQQNAVKPVNTWKFTCKGSLEDLEVLESFQYRHGGNARPFYFTDDRGVQRTVRFTEPKLSREILREFSTTSVTHGKVVGFTATVSVKEAL